MVSRIASLFLAASLAHLNVARADVACATHDRHPPAAPSQPGGDSGHHHHDTGATPSDGKGCTTPTQQDCCQALTSCSTALGPGGAQHAAGLDLHSRAVFAAVAELVSCDAAPEPPPPRV